MKRRVKRKYTRRVLETAPESTPEPIKAESKVIVPSVVTQADIDMLPASLVYQLQAGTKQRALANRISGGQYPDNLKERTEQMVRRFRGY